MTDALQWIAIVAAGGMMARYALYRDRKEHSNKASQPAAGKEQPSLFSENTDEKPELTRV